MGIMGLNTNRSFYRARKTDTDYQPRSEKELRTAASVRQAGKGGTKSAEARRVNRERLGELVSTKVPNWASIGVTEALKLVRDAAPAQRRFINRLLAMPADKAESVQNILGLKAGAKNTTTAPSRAGSSSSGLRTQIPVIVQYPPASGYKIFTPEFLSELQPGEYTLNNGYMGSFDLTVTSASAERVHFKYNGSGDSFGPYDFVPGAHFVRK